MITEGYRFYIIMFCKMVGNGVRSGKVVELFRELGRLRGVFDSGKERAVVVEKEIEKIKRRIWVES